MNARGRAACLTFFLLAVVAVMCWSRAALAQVARFEFDDGRRPARVATRRGDWGTYFNLSDVALAVDGIRYWTPSNDKMTLSVADHLIRMSRDSRFAALDSEIVNLKAPIVLREGEYWVPHGFMTGPLAEALNVSVEWEPREQALRAAALRPAVESLSLKPTGDGTIVELGLTSGIDFTARSRTRSTIELMFPGARLPDSLAVAQSTDHVSGVVLEESAEGVRAEIAVTGRAGSYEVELLHDPHRLEVLVRGGYERAAPSPRLRDVKHLAPGAGGVLDLPGLGTETVMIDPGHGGSDSGSRGRSGLEEKDVTLSLARELSRALQREGFYAFMTRSSDSFIPQDRRAEIANLAVADIFVSVQCGAWYSGWASGFSVCYYDPPASVGRARSESGGRGLPRSNGERSDPITEQLRWERLQESHIGESRALARAISVSMGDALPLNNRGVAGRTLGLLAACGMPAVQVEVGYLTNRDEEALLSDEGFLRDVARAIADGVAAYRAASDDGRR